MQLKPVSGSTPEERLAELGLDLPPVPEAVADYVTHTQIGSIVPRCWSTGPRCNNEQQARPDRRIHRSCR